MKTKAITFAELKAALDGLTPEQLEMPVCWTGEERGGRINLVEVMTEDHINPSGDGMEPVSDVRRLLVDREGMTEAEADAEIASHKVVVRKGQPLLVTDL